MTNEETIIVAVVGVTVSSLVWGRYRRPMPGMVEAVLMRNPGLGARAEIAVGTRVIFPAPPSPQVSASGVVTLWD